MRCPIINGIIARLFCSRKLRPQNFQFRLSQLKHEIARESTVSVHFSGGHTPTAQEAKDGYVSPPCAKTSIEFKFLKFLNAFCRKMECVPLHPQIRKIRNEEQTYKRNDAPVAQLAEHLTLIKKRPVV